MKKNLLALLLVGAMVLSMTACGDKQNTNNENNANAENTTENAEPENNVAEGCVELGEYKGVEVTVAKTAASDVEIENYTKSLLTNYLTEENGITDRAVADGDSIFLSYEGKIDGVTFDGGTSPKANLVIGSHTFIDDFEEQLIGVMPGETKDVNVTFPADCDKEDLAGKDAVFTCTVFYIVPEFDDAYVKALDLGYETVEDVKASAKEYIQMNYDSQYETEVENAVVEAVMNNATFGKLKAEDVTNYAVSVENSVGSQASMYGIDNETYASMFYGTNFETMVSELSESYAKQDILFKAIAEKENLTLSDEDLDARLQEYADMYGAESVDDLFTEGLDKEEYRNYFLFDDVINFLVENAVVKEQ